jgi:mRNA interferase RelE/StbE
MRGCKAPAWPEIAYEEAVSMAIRVVLMPPADRDLKALDGVVARRVTGKLRVIEIAGRVVGDVRRLTGQPPRFRLRVGDYRVLFPVELGTIKVYRIVHRREAYS